MERVRTLETFGELIAALERPKDVSCFDLKGCFLGAELTVIDGEPLIIMRAGYGIKITAKIIKAEIREESTENE